MRIQGGLGTVLALLSPTVAPAQLTPTTKAVTAGLDRARPALLKHLQQSRGDVLALVCLAAVHDGLDRGNATLRRASKRLRRTVLNGTYGAALRLMVLADDPEFFGPLTQRDLDQFVDRDVKNLLHNRIASGFTYRKRNDYPDLSNTQYACLGLRAAISLGAKIDPKIWQKVLVGTLKQQADDGGFGYTRRQRRKKPYASMTVAGITVLEVCKQNLPPAVLRKHAVSDALGLAWRWIEAHRGDIGGSRTLSCFYFHYGLERASVLSDVRKVADVDWYDRGARMLLEHQHPEDGSWRSSWEIRPGGLPGPGSPVDTAFAVLFLRRKFTRHLPRHYARLQNLGVQATQPEIDAAAKRAIGRGTAAIPDILKSMRSATPPRRLAAAIALRRLAGEDFGYRPELPPERCSAALKAAEKWWLRRNSGR